MSVKNLIRWLILESVIIERDATGREAEASDADEHSERREERRDPLLGQVRVSTVGEFKPDPVWLIQLNRFYTLEYQDTCIFMR